MDDKNNEELESFRRQWLEEVASRSKGSGSNAQGLSKRPERRPSTTVGGTDSYRQPPAAPPAPQYAPPRVDEHTGNEGQSSVTASPSFDKLSKDVRSMSISAEPEDDMLLREPRPQPTSALEHFEQAARNEAEGNLGDSLELYRKAYKLDSKVDQTYRKKHFPPSTLQVSGANPSNSSSTVPNTAHHSPKAAPAVSTPELVASFARLRIPVADPIIENTPPPPCPIANVPSEVLAAILKRVALLDPASLPRVALVCRRLAYHISHDQHIWRRLCQGPEFGFGSMHYSFACDVKGAKLHTSKPRYTPFPFGSGACLTIPKPLASWSQVFQAFPRIRFTGIYISTVNYTRTGLTTDFQSSSWSSPMHIVTYYRYLRFYPDGTLISLLGTTKPVDVVPYISTENLEIVKDGVPATTHAHHPHGQHGQPGHHRSSSSTTTDPATQQPSANPVPPTAASALKKAARGRWHLAKPPRAEPESDTESSSSSLETGQSPTEPPAPPPSTFRPTNAATREASASSSTVGPDLHDVFVETEGADPKYTYTMHLSLRSSITGASNPSKNTKLAWKGFWSYNHLTDDWAEFGLRNDRAFVFRRVRGWGMN